MSARSDRRGGQWEAPGEIVPIASEEPHTGSVAPRHDAKAVMFDFVQPVRADRVFEYEAPGFHHIGRRRSDVASGWSGARPKVRRRPEMRERPRRGLASRGLPRVCCARGSSLRRLIETRRELTEPFDDHRRRRLRF